MRNPFTFLLLAGILVGCGQPQGELGQSQEGLAHYRYVLVHGAWQAAFCWDSVVQKLQAEGETVDTITLPAHGTDSLQAIDATLGGYVQALHAVVHNGGSLPVHLVGHSLGGLVISQYAESDPSSLADLIYVAGALPQNGQSAIDLASVDPYSLLGQYMVVDTTAMTADLPVSALRTVLCDDCSDKELQPLIDHHRVEPLIPAITPVSLTAANFGAVPKKYIYTLNDRAISYTAQLTMTSTVTLAKSAAMNTAHQPMLSDPGPFTDTLLEVAR